MIAFYTTLYYTVRLYNGRTRDYQHIGKLMNWEGGGGGGVETKFTVSTSVFKTWSL